MPRQRHEIPTHLNVEDRAFYGLSARQFMHLMAGLAGAYTLWNQWPDWPTEIRIALAALAVLLAAILALVRPHGRGFEEWAFIAVHYAAVPKASVWLPVAPQDRGDENTNSGWVDLQPRVAWERPTNEGQVR